MEKGTESKQVDFSVLPWALDLLGPSALPAGSASGGAAPLGSAAPEAVGDDSADEQDCIVDASQVMAELQSRRAALADVGEGEAHFRWRLRGGAWTAAHKGLTYDAFSAGPIVKGGLAEAWCVQWGVTRSASWSISMYGEEASLTMAKAWVHLHEWFFRTCQAHRGDSSWDFCDEVLEQYEELPALVELYGVGSQRCKDRIDAMRRIRPRRPA